MGRREKTSAAKIRNGAGEATSSLSGESAFTHQGTRERDMERVGETDGKDPQMARGGRSGSQGDPNVDGCAQARVWSNAAATTSPRCAFGWFVSRLRERQAPLAVVDEGEAPIGDEEMIRHSMTFLKSTAPHVIGRGGRMLRRIEDFCGVFLSLSDLSSDTIMLTMYGSMRGCALVQCIGEMLTEGIYSVIDTLARQGF